MLDSQKHNYIIILYILYIYIYIYSGWW